MKQYKKIVLKGDGIQFKVEEKKEKLIIIATAQDTSSNSDEPQIKTIQVEEKSGKKKKESISDSDSVSVSETSEPEVFISKQNRQVIGDYKNPPIPDGFFYVEGKWKKGFVIEHLDKYDRSQFVWVPVGFLERNATLGGITFQEQFGRRRFEKDFWDNKYFENWESELKAQYQSVEKYGGFYISRYTISHNKRSGAAQSVAGEYPWVNLKFDYAKGLASHMINENHVKSHMLYGAEYDSVLQWFLQTKARTEKEIIKNSENWGHYDDMGEFFGTAGLKKTGETKEACTNGIYDFTGNVYTMTQELANGGKRIRRGGGYGSSYPAATRHEIERELDDDQEGLRVALWLA